MLQTGAPLAKSQFVCKAQLYYEYYLKWADLAEDSK